MKLIERIVFFFARLKLVIKVNFEVFVESTRKAVKAEIKKFIEDKYTGTEPTE